MLLLCLEVGTNNSLAFPEEQSAQLLTFPEVPEDEEETARVRASNDRIVLVCELGLLVLRKLMARLTTTDRPAPVRAAGLHLPVCD